MTLNSLLYYRSKLDRHDQAIYDELFQHWMHLDDNFTIGVPHCDLSVLTQAVHLDNPMLFYIDYYQITYAKTPDSLRLKGGYLYTREQIKGYLKDCEKWGEYIMKKLPSAGVNEKALWLHDVIIANVRYGRGDGMNSHNVIGVIKDKQAVCEGISKTYKHLCDLAGIPCIVVTGFLDREPHGWNMLWVGGGTSFVDVTHDIRSGGGYNRDHFLRSSAEMKGYRWDTSLLPECNVYNASNAFFTVHTKHELIDTVRRNGNRDSLQISFQFDRPLTEVQISSLVNDCVLAAPPLLERKISFSEDRQMLYIRK